VTVRAPAKVNLLLRTSGQPRDDGYHELRTVFMAVDVTDEVACQWLPGGRIEVRVEGAQAHLVPSDGTDLAGRAAALLRERYGHRHLGVKLCIHKVIPVAGGMAGGSADAAAALRGCNALWGLGVNDAALSVLAAELGADVPFALLGGVALGTDRGDRLTPLQVTGQYHWAFAVAKHGLSTADVFRCLDAMPAAALPTPVSDSSAEHTLLAALANGDVAAVGRSMHNDLTAPARLLRPEIGETLAFGRQLPGVLGAVLCGSGATCAFLCTSQDAVDAVTTSLSSLSSVRTTWAGTGPSPGVHETSSATP